jgi:ribosomal protein S18 acetylase RimI-like enzyme
MKPPDPAIIRRATRADVAAMARLEEVSFPGDRLSRRSLRHLVTAGHAICLVAEVDGAVAGDAIVLLRRGSRRGRLYSLAVDPGRRGAGLGSALLAAAEDGTLQADRDTLYLEVRDDNAAARRRYDAAGYRETARLETFYEDGATALRMEKRLGTQA